MESIITNHNGKVVKALAEAFGKDRVRICSEFHLQVFTPCKKYKHNVYLPNGSPMKLQKNGKCTSHQVRSIKELVEKLGGEAEKSDLDVMQDALDMAELFNIAKQSISNDDKQAIFVDAGFKKGIANIGAVMVTKDQYGPKVEARSYFAKMENSQIAELKAIELGATMGDCVIYSDSQSVVAQLTGPLAERVKWIERKKNKVADKIANMRKH